MLQLLSLVAMEPPIAFEADALRDEKVRVAAGDHPDWNGRAGACRRRPRPVRDRLGRRPRRSRATGTRRRSTARARSRRYVALRVEVENWRWAGVPFYLRTGKHLARRATEIAIAFNRPPLMLFKESASDPESNLLAMRIQPDEGILLRFAVKVPELGLDVRSVNMDFTYGSSFLTDAPEAYETLLLDAMLGDASLFTRADEVEAAWGLVTPLNRIWQAWGAGGGEERTRPRRQDASRPPQRLASSTGASNPTRAAPGAPDAADLLLERDGRRWRRL